MRRVAALTLALSGLVACQRAGVDSTATTVPTTTTPPLQLDLTVDDATRQLIDVALGRDPSTEGARAGEEAACPAVDQAAVASATRLAGPVQVELTYAEGSAEVFLRCEWTDGERAAVLATVYEVDDFAALQRLAKEQYQRRVDIGVASGLTIGGEVVGVLAGGVWFRWSGTGLTDDELLALAGSLAATLSAPSTP